MRLRVLLIPALALSLVSSFGLRADDDGLSSVPAVADGRDLGRDPDVGRDAGHGNPATAASDDAADAAEAAAPDPLALPAEGPPVAPGDPASLATVLTAAERTIRDPARPPEQLAAAGHWQQVAYTELARRPDWVDPVLAEMPGELHAAVRRNVFAGVRLREMSTPSDPARAARVRDLPRWRIVDPPPADQLRSFYAEAEAASGVHWSYLAAINLVETRMGRIVGDSVAGAQGPMQFMPATWAEWGQGNVHDHRDAILAAGRYLRWGGMPGDVNGALFRYNRDRRYVDAVRTYAEEMQADPRAFYGYYHWQVYFNTRADNVWLAPGYDRTGG